MCWFWIQEACNHVRFDRFAPCSGLHLQLHNMVDLMQAPCVNHFTLQKLQTNFSLVWAAPTASCPLHRWDETSFTLRGGVMELLLGYLWDFQLQKASFQEINQSINQIYFYRMHMHTSGKTWVSNWKIVKTSFIKWPVEITTGNIYRVWTDMLSIIVCKKRGCALFLQFKDRPGSVYSFLSSFSQTKMKPSIEPSLKQVYNNKI